ncbi:hypothetical protein ACHAXS_002718 [Conticribra weissflogii]
MVDEDKAEGEDQEELNRVKQIMATCKAPTWDKVERGWGQQSQRNRNNNGRSNLNPHKRFNNMLYCHSCGFDVNHDGWNCMNRKSYHQNWITREKARQLMKEDRWLGSHSGSHKNLYSNGTQTGEQIN